MEQEGEEEPPNGLEDAIILAGNFGIWQKIMFVFISASQIFSAMNAVAAVFLSATPEHRCQLPHESSFQPLLSSSRLFPFLLLPSDECKLYKHNYTAIRDWIAHSEEFKSVNISTLEESDLFNETLFPTLQGALNNETFSCSEHVYSREVFQTTIVTEWHLVCSRRWLRATVQATYMAGILVGSFVYGQTADRIGRRKTMLFALICLIATGIATSFAESYIAVLTLRFFLATNCAGLMVTNFVLVMELIKPEARSVCGMCNGIPFGMGVALVSLFAYFLRDWRQLQLGIAIAPAILLVYFWNLPESPRWLASKRRPKEALDMLKIIAKCNKKILPSDEAMIYLLTMNEPSEDPEKKSRSFLSFFEEQWTLIGTPVMRRRTIVSFYMWFSSAMIYYGLIFYGSNIKADLFMMVGTSGLIEIPAFIIVAFCLSRVGRRVTSSILFFICCFFLLVLMAIPQKHVYILFGLATAGKFFDTAVFQLCYLYTSELFPTHVRNVAVGTSSMFARVGASIAPYIIDLLGDISFAAPSAVFGILSFIAGGLSLLLPETLNKVLPQTVEEVEMAYK